MPINGEIVDLDGMIEPIVKDIVYRVFTEFAGWPPFSGAVAGGVVAYGRLQIIRFSEYILLVLRSE